MADVFVRWSEDRQIPTAMAMAYHLKGRTVAEHDPTDARENFERGLEVVEERIRGCVLVEINLKRETIPLVYRTNPSAVCDVALDVIRKRAPPQRDRKCELDFVMRPSSWPTAVPPRWLQQRSEQRVRGEPCLCDAAIYERTKRAALSPRTTLRRTRRSGRTRADPPDG